MSSDPDNRVALAVALFGSGPAVLVAVQAPALIPALSPGLFTWGALYLFVL